MQNRIDIEPARTEYRETIIDLLQSEKLPFEDLTYDLDHFFTAIDNGLVIGVIGLEIYGRSGLLRSMVVKPGYRGMKIAEGLINELENLGKSLGLENMYLLTETAQRYFLKKGYKVLDRNEAPESLKKSTEFSHACPASATLMQKKL